MSISTKREGFHVPDYGHASMEYFISLEYFTPNNHSKSLCLLYCTHLATELNSLSGRTLLRPKNSEKNSKRLFHLDCWRFISLHLIELRFGKTQGGVCGQNFPGSFSQSIFPLAHEIWRACPFKGQREGPYGRMQQNQSRLKMYGLLREIQHFQFLILS